MIARGDLAVELGSARLAEIQEELLWLCEAAMAVRAECVMLNKDPYILDAIEALVNVMSRMHEHQRKKFSRLRALQWLALVY